MAELMFQCCFCGQGIKSSQSDPCSLNIMINYDEGEDRQFDQNFWCHLACFKGAVTSEIPLYSEHLGHDE